MIQVQEINVEPFTNLRLGEAALAKRHLGIVATATPESVVSPGCQLTASVSFGNPILDRIGKVYIDDLFYPAAGRLMQQFAYNSGIAPGNAGLFRDPESGEVDVLASARVIAELKNVDESSYVGYFNLVKIQGLPDSHEGFAEAITTRGRLNTIRTLGVTVANLSMMLRPNTLDSLVDPVDHPILGGWLREAGLRQFEEPGL